MATLTAKATEMATATAKAIALAMATATMTIMKGRLPLHLPAMCSVVAGATPCLHPHGHKGKCIHQRCVMGVTLLRVYTPFQGGGFLTARHGLFFYLEEHSEGSPHPINVSVCPSVHLSVCPSVCLSVCL
jgi:hypothetical protein